MDRRTQYILYALVILVICSSLCFVAYLLVGFPPFQRNADNPSETSEVSEVPVAAPTNAPTPEPPTPSPQPPTPVPVATATVDTATLPPQCLVSQLLYLRAGPGTHYEPPLSLLSENALLIPLARNPDGDWIRVQVYESGEIGWVNAPFVTCNVPSANLPEGNIPPPPAVDCPFEPQAEFAALWRTYERDLGCPEQQTATGGLFVEQAFEKGYMIWAGEPDWFFVTLGGSEGRWYSFQDEAAFDALFSPNHEGATCEPDQQPPSGKIQPIRGFGAIWCGQFKGTDFQSAFGFATEEEHGELNNLLVTFANGYMVRDSHGRIFVFFIDDIDSGTYVRRAGGL